MGLEPYGASSKDDITPHDLTDRWYHENTFVVNGTNCSLESVPVVFTKRRGKQYSASDGGFLTYKGRLVWETDSLLAKMRLTDSDYAMVVSYRYINPADSNSSLSFEEQVKRGILVPDSSAAKPTYSLRVLPTGLLLNGVRYQLKGKAR
ncbi:hypothetical protein [Hymenobacter sp. DG25B]|uniref:hypothetical protein n=1 Tax=Hymenobacter sp. DG25B TaxID=1385664 RepID=UPI0012E0C2DA|nr:hypothetical protein [Hymenobacter sp. DG25B]